MYFDFEENHPDIGHIPRASGWRDWILLLQLAFVIHVVVFLGARYIPAPDRRTVEEQIAQRIALQQQRQRESERFVFVQPMLETPATRPPSPRAEASDRDRNAQTRVKPPHPTNALPFSRGNTPERVESPAVAPAPPQQRAQPAPPQPTQPAPPQQQANAQSSAEAGSPPPRLATNGPLVVPSPRTGSGRVAGATGDTGTGAGRGLLGSAMRELQQYARSEAFDNPGGGNSPYGQAIQFDTKGVEFGPWLRRFIAQIKRNWFIPYAAMAMKGHVVVTFYIHKDGSITELMVPGPCNVDAFNRAAYNAMASSNPTYPLPPEYPSDKAFFTVTFFYNENPNGGAH